MSYITATEFKNNLGKYLVLAESHDIYITKNGKTIAKLTSPNQDRREILNSLIGCIPSNIDTKTLIDERRDTI